jgi:hypothetical protein
MLKSTRLMLFREIMPFVLELQEDVVAMCGKCRV